MEESDYERRKVYGVAEIVIAGKNVVAVDVLLERQTPEGLKERFKDKLVFLRNKNLQSFPHGLKGGIAYLPQEEAIVIIIRARCSRALVRQLYPQMRDMSGLYVTSTFQQAWFLQQVAGKQLVEFNDTLRSRKIDDKTGMIVPLVDSQGYIKCDWQGPDIGRVTLKDLQVDTKFDNYLSEGAWTLPTQQEPPTQRTTAGTIYVYAKDPQHLKTVLVEKKTGTSLVSIPVGPKIYSNRYVTL
jgi:hypothetical protein